MALQPKTEAAAATAPRPVGVRGYRVRNVAKAAERRREILLGAARAFAAAATMPPTWIRSRASAVWQGHIYHYFRSKEEIFTEIRIDAVSRALERLMAIAPLAETDPGLALRKAISSVVARILEEEARYEPVLADPASLSPESRERIRSLGRRYERMFANILRSGIDQGVFVAGDPKLMTFVILRAAFTVANWYRVGGKWKPQWIVDQVTEQLVRSVRRSLTAS